MQGAEVEVALVPLAETTSGGDERVELGFAGGPGQPRLPFASVASGGELSRTVLACRSVQVDLDDVPTLVFDEVDAGIGGRAGVAVGRRLSALARARQVRRRHPPAADRRVRRPARPRRQAGRDGDRDRARRHGARGGAHRACSPGCPGARRPPPTPRSCSPRRDGPGPAAEPAGLRRRRRFGYAWLPSERPLRRTRPRTHRIRRTPRPSRSRSLLRRPRRRQRVQQGIARVDARTKRLALRAQPGRDRRDRPRGPRSRVRRGAASRSAWPAS